MPAAAPATAVAFPEEVMGPVKFALVVTVEAATAVLQPKPVPDVHFSALADVLHDGTARSEGVVAVSAPRTVLAVWFANVAVKVPVVVTALDGVLDKIVPSPVNVTLVTVPAPLALWHAPSAPRYSEPEQPENKAIISELAASVIAPVVVVFLTMPVPSVAQFWLLLPSVRVAVLSTPVPP